MNRLGTTPRPGVPSDLPDGDLSFPSPGNVIVRARRGGARWMTRSSGAGTARERTNLMTENESRPEFFAGLKGLLAWGFA